MTSQSAAADDNQFEGLKSGKNRENFVRLSVNLSVETSEVFKSLIERKGFSISEGVRRAIAIWEYLEDEKSRGNELAVIERDNSVRKVVLL